MSLRCLQSLLLFSMGLTLWAQTTTSTLSGVVKDASGAVVPSAKIAVVNEGSGVVVSAVSNEAGLYHVIGLSPASYRLEAEASGFQKLVHPGIVVQISESVQVDLTLQLGNVQETVSVAATTPVLQTQTAGIDQLV